MVVVSELHSDRHYTFVMERNDCQPEEPYTRSFYGVY